MNAPHNKLPQPPNLAPSPTDAEVLDEAGWFVVPAASETRPVVRPKSSPLTGDDEVDRWLR
jgi:hypothetical protein